MALLGSLTTHPPDGWKYLQRETGVWIYGDIYSELVEHVIAHRRHKGLTPIDPDTVGKEVQRQICLGAFPGVCNAEQDETYVPFKDIGRSLSLDKIEAFSRTLLAWLASGTGFVSKEESSARAATCRSCPFNKTAPACVCTAFFKAINAMIPADRNEDGLKICTLCGCSLKAKVLAPLSVVREGNPPNLNLPEWCWQK